MNRPTHHIAVQGGFVSGESVCEALDAFLEHVLADGYMFAVNDAAALKLALDQHEPFEIIEAVPASARVGYPVDPVDPIERVGSTVLTSDEAFDLLLPFYCLKA